ncbi:ribosomal protein S18-alanine N-acetyltransferase [Aeromicrobium sp. Leaf350]|uniref:ribosomal protein S18-alanine N-acetyltransferase n=1 Tax=Aeromicrobium sp. Leaf350 TaxID=2876565 RepID=UPI001E4D96D1|nr:ribosomal protein S18-alanine N-acetyltransferase [Aeromicrobium sp. Leaf350]
MTATVVVRAATQDDVPVLAELERACFDDPWSASSVASEVASVERHVRLAVEGETAVGWSSTLVVAETADLLRVAVRPASRRRGVARVLVEELLRTAADAGAERILLEVAADNTGAQALYGGLGFREIHRRRAYYADGGDALVMERALP